MLQYFKNLGFAMFSINTESLFDKINEDTKLYIFSFLHSNTLRTINLVCKEWKKFSEQIQNERIFKPSIEWIAYCNEDRTSPANKANEYIDESDQETESSEEENSKEDNEIIPPRTMHRGDLSIYRGWSLEDS